MNPRRLVIFCGPHKSASSTVQEFLVQYATGRPRYRKLKAFQEWRWPVIKSSANKIPARKQWAQLVVGSDEAVNEDLHQALKDAFDKAPNVALGSEEFDRFGAVPWSGRDGLTAIRKITEWANAIARLGGDGPPQIDLVVNFRTPRQTQWISIWKQLMALDDLQHESRTSVLYPEWVCARDETSSARLWEYLDCVANPLGLTLHLLSNLPPNVKVSLVDMGGVAEKGLDIAHVSACQILGLPCSAHWVRGINRTLVVNPKSRQLEGVSTAQLDEINWLLQQRDCSYQQPLDEFQRQGRLEILHSLDLTWGHCQIEAGSSKQEIFGSFQNTTFLVEVLKSQYLCQSDQALNLTEMMAQSNLTADLHGVRKRVSAANIASKDWMWVIVLQWLFVAALFGSLFRVRKHNR